MIETPLKSYINKLIYKLSVCTLCALMRTWTWCNVISNLTDVAKVPVACRPNKKIVFTVRWGKRRPPYFSNDWVDGLK